MSPNQTSRRPRIPWWRRQYVVNREMQKRYAWSAVIIGVVSSSLSAGMLLWSFWVFNIWQGQRLPVQVVIVIIAVLFINVTGIYTAAVLSTSRIAGPLFNLLKQFSKLSAGDFGARASFRQNDEIHYVAKRFNDMATELEKRQIESLKTLDQIMDSAKDGCCDLKSLQSLRLKMTAQKKHGLESESVL
jgi:signal transduction histidine kinase